MIVGAIAMSAHIVQNVWLARIVEILLSLMECSEAIGCAGSAREGSEQSQRIVSILGALSCRCRAVRGGSLQAIVLG